MWKLFLGISHQCGQESGNHSDDERWKLEAFRVFGTCDRARNRIYHNNYKDNMKRWHLLHSCRTLEITLRTIAFMRKVSFQYI